MNQWTCGLKIYRCYVRVKANVRDRVKIKVTIRIMDKVTVRKLQYAVTSADPQSALLPIAEFSSDSTL